MLNYATRILKLSKDAMSQIQTLQGYDDDLPLNGLFLAPGPARHQPEEYTCERLVSRLPIKT